MLPTLDKQLYFKKPANLVKYYLSKQYAKLYSKDKFVAVCGTLGKTTTVRFSQAVLSQKFKTLSTEANKDHLLEVTSALLRINPSYKKIILEFGGLSGEMDFYNSLIQPKVVIVTRMVSPSHDSEVSDDIVNAVNKLLSRLPTDGIAILDWDDASTKKLSKEINASIIYYGADAQNCSVWAGNAKIENFKTTFELNLGVERVKVELPLLGLHQIYPALAAAALGVAHDIPLTKIKIALESTQGQEHKMQLLFGPNGSFLLDDTYSSSPFELEAAIDTLLQIPARRRILILGEINNSIKYSAEDFRKIAEKIYKEKLDFVYLGTGLITSVFDELKSLGFWEERIEANLQNSQLVGKLLNSLGKGDVCLIKASRTVRLDEVVKRIAKK